MDMERYKKMLSGVVNWTAIASNWVDYAMQGYFNVFKNFTYPLIFIGIIGYIYALNKSAISASAGICIIFTVYGVTAIFNYPEYRHKCLFLSD